MKRDSYKPCLTFLACFLLLAVTLFAPNVAYADSLTAGQTNLDALTDDGSDDAQDPPHVSGSVDAIAMHRMYNMNSGEHFYTSNTSERDHLISVGWFYEGVGWMAPQSGAEVYRLYNPNAGDHHYTLSVEERDWLVTKGWNYEGVGWYSAPEADEDRSPLYRQYNPNAHAGNHNFTLDVNERDFVIRAGWRDEGIGWYGYSVPSDYQYDVSPWTANISGDDTLDRYLYLITKSHTSLRSCYNYVAGMPYISGSKFWANPHVLSDATTISFAKEMYQNGGGNCYRYAALFMWLARALGYDAQVISGWVPAISGGSAPHGWVEINEGGTTYIYDPDMAHALPSNNWYHVTYSNAPLVYHSW